MESVTVGASRKHVPSSATSSSSLTSSPTSSSTSGSSAQLFQPLKLGGGLFTLSHRVVLAPLTRLRAGFGEVPRAMNVEYYEQRATEGGLLIGEASQIHPEGQGMAHSPGCFTVAQMEGWAKVCEAVHRRKGIFFMQLWHMGRNANTNFTPGGVPVVSASNLPLKRGWGFSDREVLTPRALETHEIADRVRMYAQATSNSIQYGCDGVEIHGANGYLIDQFLCDSSNKRTDRYGGSIENRCRFALEVTDACIEAAGDSRRVGIRFSPYGAVQTLGDTDPKPLFTYLLTELNKRNLAYVHLIEPRGFHRQSKIQQPQDVTRIFRETYNGVLLTASGYDRKKGIDVVEKGTADAVVYGRHYIANPDLPFRYKHDLPINRYDRPTFYTNTVKGYTDYSFHPSNPRAYDVKWSAELSKL